MGQQALRQEVLVVLVGEVVPEAVPKRQELVLVRKLQNLVQEYLQETKKHLGLVHPMGRVLTTLIF
jgi:hypothetical protein